ncbi:DNA internalization-related competence protein ComEC/Rec2 [Pseudocolwellia sp. HL-MZ19]|uniref:DNA internalization-related competence protein ComEC/Rec2 n=1 Tax=unclassified Pseudocolwellia TaxID=2848178 RepID=UPI003CF7D403
MDRWLITFFIGAILSLFMPIVPQFFCVILFIALGITCLLTKRARIVSGFFFGSAWILFNGFQYNAVWDRNNLDTTQIFSTSHTVIGTVKSIPSKTVINIDNKKNGKSNNGISGPSPKINDTFNYKFNFEVSHINQQVLEQPFILRLNWNRTTEIIQQDGRYNLNVKFKPPNGLANKGGFNYQVWLRQNQIVATGYVVKPRDKQVNQNFTLETPSSHRQKLYSQSLKLLPEHDLSPLLTALSFGERSTIESNIWTILNKTNTQHLIAISGLHLGLIATGSFLLINFLLRILPLRLFMSSTSNISYFLLSNNIKYFAVLLSCSLTFYYAYLAGFSLPTVRALIMLLLFWTFRIVGIKCSLVTWLFLTVFIVLISTPMSLISGSFWLSFYAVSLILLTSWRFKHTFVGKNKLSTWLKSLFWVQLSLSIFMLPISMLFNFQLSFVSIFANLFAVPVMSFTSIPLSLLAVLIMPFSHLLSEALYQLALFSIEGVWFWLTFLAEQPWATVSVSFIDIVIISLLLSVVGVISFLSVKKSSAGFLVLISISFIAYLVITNKQDADWKIVVLDVGQGLSIVIEKNNKAILYDTGASYPSGFNMVEASVLPYLKFKGITALNKVIISHSDNDHAGGLNVLKESIHITELIANDPELKGDSRCTQGDSFNWQGLTFNVLWPLDDDKYVGDENDDSCVIKISDGSSSVLLTGDISKRVEKLLVADTHMAPLLKSDVIIAPHHGSKTSSSHTFIQAVSPQYVIYSTGFMNRWRMPSTIVQQRYTDENIQAFNTAHTGMVEVKIEMEFLDEESIMGKAKLNKSNLTSINTHETKIKVTPYKQEMYPFWFAH